ncbi:chemotaxis protein methyltransferase CheR [Desulfitispora alkaliphila]|uniref:CheR family methyltransferase n=1 Tax=Desulfitispora alkaliphila TaxID=622674 RepID=UPI003D24600A
MTEHGGYTIKLTDDEFVKIKSMVFKEIGVNLTEAKRSLVISRLNKRLRELGLLSFSQYIEYTQDNRDELEIIFNRITTNVTKFFRENHHFEYLYEQYLPVLEQKITNIDDSNKTLRVWSAACSTGEEPYTIAMVLSEYFANKPKWNYKILASDINTETLKKASSGIYTKKEVEEIPYNMLKKYFQVGTGQNSGLFKIKDIVRNNISFRKINLTAEKEYPIQSALDIIFCRNVFIYFSRETQAKVLNRYYEHLKPGGLLFLGHSESIGTAQELREKWAFKRHTIYERL